MYCDINTQQGCTSSIYSSVITCKGVVLLIIDVLVIQLRCTIFNQFLNLHVSHQFLFFCCFFLLNIPVNNFSVLLGWGHHFLGITSKCMLPKDTTQQPE